MSFLLLPFMQRALIAAILIGVSAPAVGIFLVQRRMALMGDGIGHVAFAGVGLGVLLGTSPVLTAVLVSIAGAVAIEVVRARGKASGDVALSILFYGGLATGVVLIGLSPAGSANIQTYLFGSILTVSRSDIVVIAVLATVVLLVTITMRRALFAVCQDEEFAKVSGLPVAFLNVTLAVTAALTVTVAMRVVGLLLVSALLVLPVAAAQQVTKSFFATFVVAIVLGVTVTTSGVLLAYPINVGPGALIVIMAILVFAIFGTVKSLRRPRRSRVGGSPTVLARAASPVDGAAQ